MKKHFAIIAMIAATVSSATATDYYWRFATGAGWWANWSANFQTSSGTQGNPAPTDNVFFNQYDYYNKVGTSQASLVIGEKTVNNLTFEKVYFDDTANVGAYKKGWVEIRGSGKTENVPHDTTLFTIKGNLTFLNSATQGTVLIAAKSEATRSLMNVVVGSQGCAPSLGNITMSGAGGDLQLTLGEKSMYGGLNSLVVYNNVNFNIGQLNMNVSRADSVGSVDNPDVDIKGVFYHNTSGTWSLAARTAAGDCHIRVGGLQSSSNVSKISNFADSTAIGDTYLVFNNAAGTSYKYAGWMREYNSVRDLNFIMTGAGEQIVYETTDSANLSQFMRGDVIVKNGTFQMGAAAGEVARVSIEGGRFSAYGSSGNVGTLKIKNLDWSKGSLIVNIDGANNCDLLSISGNFNKAGVDGYKYLIELDLSAASLDESYMIAKWSGTTNFVEGDFISNTLGDISAIFEIRNGNELWATITQVPESAAMASLFGALALALAVWRRRQ